MKSLFRAFAVLFIIATVFMVGCDSDDGGGTDPGVNPLIGTWDLATGSGSLMGVSVSNFPAATVGLIMEVDLMSDATYEVTITIQDEQTMEIGVWQSNETNITLTSNTGEIATWPFEVDGGTLTVTVDTNVFDLGVSGITGNWVLTFEKQ